MDSILGVSLLEIEENVDIEIQEEILSPRLSSVLSIQQQDNLRENFSDWLASIKQSEERGLMSRVSVILDRKVLLILFLFHFRQIILQFM